MRKILFFLFITVVLIELVARGVIFYSKISLSYRLSKGYYSFQGSLWDYMKQYREFGRKYRDHNKLIVEDIYNRKFYAPDVKISLKQLRIETNSFGMKEHKLNLRKEDGVQRIICLGSSYTLVGSDNNRFTDILERKLNGAYKNAKFEIINSGVSGQNLLQGFMCFALNWRLLEPDLVIIDFFIDDVPANGYFYLKNYAKLDKANEAWENVSDYLEEHIGTYAFIDFIYSRFFYRKQHSDGPTREGYDSYETILESFVLLAKASGAKVVLLSSGIAIDRKHNFEPDNPKRKKLETHFYGLDAETIVGCIEELNGIMKKVAQKNNVLFLDMNYAVPKDDEHFIDASHRSDKGNEVFASALMQELKKNNILNLN